MLKILNASKTIIKSNLQLLAKDYKEKTGRVVCLTCPSDIAYMLSTLKTIYKMTNFAFKREKAQYKNKKGDRTTISNNIMTDEKAIEFLKTNPERISLFSKFPENWEEVIKGTAKTSAQIEAEAQVEEATNAAIKAAEEGVDLLKEDCPECIEKRKELSKMKLADLRLKYPEVKDTSIKGFIEKVLILKK